MDTNIRYVRADDGVSIAYRVLGSGPPLVIMPTLLSHIEFEWQTSRRGLYERLAEHHQVVRYDGRGQGLSDREPADLSLAAQVSDLDAVVRGLGLDKVSLLAQSHAGPAAIAYAADRPEKMARLVLCVTFARLADLFAAPLMQTLLPLAEQDWSLFAMTLSHARVGWTKPESSKESAALFQASITPEFFQRFLSSAAKLDASDRLDHVQAPTLVIHPRDFTILEPAISSQLASTIPNAQLFLVSGSANSLFTDDDDEALLEIERFLGVHEGVRAPVVSMPRYLRNRSPELTSREVETLRLLAVGHHNKEIAQLMNLSIHTVERHIANIYAKLGAHGRVEATAHAIRSGIVSASGHWQETESL